MAEVQPLNALHYNLAAVPSLADVVAPPYDVIDADPRAELLARSPFNVVEIDLPRGARGRRPLRARRRDARGVDPAGDPRRRPRAGALGADPGVRRPRRLAADAPRAPLPGPGDALRGRRRPPARAHPAGAEAGPAAADRGDPAQPLADLLAARGRRLAPPRAAFTATSPGARSPTTTGTVHRIWRVGDPERPSRGDRRARRLRAADRRRPPPLRDRAHLRRRDRRRRARTATR